MSELDVWRDAFDEMYRLTVVPRRSVARVRTALARGDDPGIYLEAIEAGMASCATLFTRMDDRPRACPRCRGTGVLTDPGQ